MVDIERVLQSDGGGEEAGVEEVAGDKREEMTRTAPSRRWTKPFWIISAYSIVCAK